jgi:hypothetical protein
LKCLSFLRVFFLFILGSLKSFSLIIFALTYLDDNNLVGVLPNELYVLRQLVNISYYNNTMVSGAIPSSYGSLPTLRELDISSNAVLGTIPNSICNATMLRRIDFKMNIIQGTIPSCIGALTSLSAIRLDRNMLSGTIPSHINRISTLGTLEYKCIVLRNMLSEQAYLNLFFLFTFFMLRISVHQQ